MTIPCLNQQHLFMLTMNRNIIYLKNNNIPQHDKPAENGIDFSLDLEFLTTRSWLWLPKPELSYSYDQKVSRLC